MTPLLIYAVVLIILFGLCGIYLLYECYINSIKEEERTREWRKKEEERSRCRGLRELAYSCKWRYERLKYEREQEEKDRLFSELKRIRKALEEQ